MYGQTDGRMDGRTDEQTDTGDSYITPQTLFANYMGCRMMSIQLNYKKAHIDWINCIGELSKNQKNLFLANSKWPPRAHNSWYQAAKQ